MGTVYYTHYTLTYVDEYIYYHNSPPYTSHTHNTHAYTYTLHEKIHARKNVYNTTHMRQAKKIHAKNTYKTRTHHTHAHGIHGPPVIETKI